MKGSRRWRKMDPITYLVSQKQIDLLKRLGFKADPSMTRVFASKLITQLLKERK